MNATLRIYLSQNLEDSIKFDLFSDLPEIHIGEYGYESMNIVFKLISNTITNNGTFYTDSNGLFHEKRELKF